MNEVLASLFERDLLKLRGELLAYEQEERIWATAAGITNSAGNLALHLTGNLNHFIGAILGNTGYVRNREAEFSLRDVPRSQLIAEAEALIPVIHQTLSKLDGMELEKTYPLEVFGKPMTTGFFLQHLYGHFNYHLGQVNYHRRLVGK